MSPSERYTNAYKAFWLNCVMVKADNLKARCPFVCNGTEAATAGCANGGTDAEAQIATLVHSFPAEKVQAYLRIVASDRDNVATFRNSGYFGGGPQSDTQAPTPPP